MAMASSQASSSRRQGAILDMASAGPSGLPAITGPTDQLQQIQKKLQALVASTGQLQFELAHAPTLDWPTILSRYGALVSQTYTLSSSLTSSSSTFLPSQLDAVQRVLEEEAKTSNYFMSQEAALRANTSEGIPEVKFTDERNALPRLAATPTVTLDGEKIGRLGEALRSKLEPEILGAYEEAIAALRRQEGENENGDGAAAAAALGKEGAITHEDLNAILKAVKAHDEIANRALRAWYHVRWRPDEEDQTYDFRMRLPEGDTGELGDDDDGEEAEGEGGVENDGEAFGEEAADGEEAAAVVEGEGEGDADAEQDDDEDMEEVT